MSARESRIDRFNRQRFKAKISFNQALDIAIYQKTKKLFRKINVTNEDFFGKSLFETWEKIAVSYTEPTMFWNIDNLIYKYLQDVKVVYDVEPVLNDEHELAEQRLKELSYPLSLCKKCLRLTCECS